MPRVRDTQTTFTRGELDPRLVGRIDVAAYRNGAAKLRNVQVIPQGGARRRPGSVYVDDACNVLEEMDLSSETWAAPNGGTVANLYDGDIGTALLTTAGIGTTDDYVVFELDFGADTSVKFLDILQVELTNGVDSLEEWNLEGQEDGGAWEVIGHTIRAMTQDLQDFRFSPTKPFRKFRFVRNGTTSLGTRNVRMYEVKAYSETTTVSAIRQFGFIFADDQRYLMVVTCGNLRVYRNTGGAEVFAVDVTIPHVNQDVLDVTYAIDNDTLVLFHEDYQPFQVLRSGDHDEWQPSDVTFTNMPQFDFGDGNEDMWSDARGWPRCGAFFQARLLMGGSTQRPSTFLASVTGSPYNLDDSTTADDKAINVTLSASGEEIPTIRHLVIGPHLILMTSSGEYYHPKSLDTGITPTNTVFRLSTRAGMDSQRTVPQVVDGAVYFVQREGQSVREAVFSEVEQNYSAPPVSLLSSHLIRMPIEIAFRRQLSTNDTNLLLYVNTDGTIAAFTLLREQEIAAFTLWVTRSGDKWVGAAAVKDDLYCASERSIDGATVRHIERFDFDVLVDDATIGGAASSASVPHLEEETVAVVLDGAAQADVTATAGTATFARASASSYQVGLPWPDVKAEEDAFQLTRGVDTTLADGETQVWVQLLTPPGNAGDGPLHARRRRTPEILLDLFETSEGKVNNNRVMFRKFGASLLDEAPPLFTGVKRVMCNLGWSRSQVVNVTQTEHQPFTLSAVTTQINTD